MGRVQPPFTLSAPDAPCSCAVFSSPHSGRVYPGELVRRSRLSTHQLRLSEDAYVEELFSAAPQFGAPLLAATLPRAFVDLNRGPGELDPALIEGVRVQGLNPRVSAGLGVVPRVVAEGVSIYPGKLKLREAQRRIDRYHEPFHRQLQGLLDRARATFGMAVLLDCHSMPSDALRAALHPRGGRPDVILGDRYGTSASSWLMDAVQTLFEAADFVVGRNTPFAGGYITQKYGRPSRGLHAIQIEIDRGLYLDEARIEPGHGFEETRQRLTGVIEALTLIGMESPRLAAE